MTTFTAPAAFLADPPVDEVVGRMYGSDQEMQGYVANLTRVWAHCPDALGVLSAALRMAIEVSGLDVVERDLVVTAAASGLGDAYCSLAFGSKLARRVGPEVTAELVRGRDRGLSQHGRLLADWARRVADDPNSTTEAHVDALRAAGFDDRQIFGLTFFVALRVAFSTVNDALGAAPDAELVSRAPQQLDEAVAFGRRAADPEGPVA